MDKRIFSVKGEVKRTLKLFRKLFVCSSYENSRAQQSYIEGKKHHLYHSQYHKRPRNPHPEPFYVSAGAKNTNAIAQELPQNSAAVQRQNGR
jgi:hypothetical protein